LFESSLFTSFNSTKLMFFLRYITIILK
jgi:hypothetical protein